MQPATDPDDPAAPVRRLRWPRIVALVGLPVIVGLVAYLAFQALRPHIYAGTVMQAPEPAASMAGLSYTSGAAVDLAEFDGDVVLVYFGYTHCPDVCPTTLSTVAKALERMDGDPGRVHVVMVTIDPERDTPELLDGYLRSFDDRFLAATGDLADLERVASLYGVYFARGDDTVDGGYTMDHTATLMGIDTDGHLRLVWPNGVSAADLAADLDALL